MAKDAGSATASLGPWTHQCFSHLLLKKRCGRLCLPPDMSVAINNNARTYSDKIHTEQKSTNTKHHNPKATNIEHERTETKYQQPTGAAAARWQNAPRHFKVAAPNCAGASTRVCVLFHVSSAHGSDDPSVSDHINTNLLESLDAACLKKPARRVDAHGAPSGTP